MSMADDQTWIIDVGVALAARLAAGDELTPIEKLLDRFWFVDYCMCNAGDLANLEDEPSDYLPQTAMMALALGLIRTANLFALPEKELERSYFKHFESVCDELRRSYD